MMGLNPARGPARESLHSSPRAPIGYRVSFGPSESLGQVAVWSAPGEPAFLSPATLDGHKTNGSPSAVHLGHPASPWPRRLGPASSAPGRLVRFPYGGGSALSCLTLAHALSRTQVTHAGRYPSPLERQLEPFPKSITAVAEAVVVELVPSRDRPPALPGNSMGSFFAFEVGGKDRRLDDRVLGCDSAPSAGRATDSRTVGASTGELQGSALFMGECMKEISMVTSEPDHGVDDTVRRSLLRHMLVARGIDQEAQQLQKQGALDLWPSAAGQEALQVASALALGPGPTIFPSFREHGVALTRGVPPDELLAQWAGETFCGWDPWQHLFFPYTLVLAAQTLHGVGYSIGSRHQGRDDFVVVYVGDGATSEGDMSEAMNLAAVESASVLFICQNNGWAISKPAAEQMTTSVAERARGFGIDSSSVSGLDPEDVYVACVQAEHHVRTKKSPHLIEAHVNRMGGHSSSDAHEQYRSSEELERVAAEDPVLAYTERLLKRGVVDDTWISQVDEDVLVIRRRLVKAYAS